MTPEEKSKLIIELMQRQEASKKELEAERQQRAADRERIDSLLKKLDMMLEYQSQNAALVKQVSQLLAQNANLEAELKLRN
jgi:predicted dinucleotide-utilizing enzyme